MGCLVGVKIKMIRKRRHGLVDTRKGEGVGAGEELNRKKALKKIYK